MNVTFYPALRLVKIGKDIFTVKDLEQKTDRTRTVTNIMHSARRIFSAKKRNKAIKRFEDDFEEKDDEIQKLVKSDIFKQDYHSIGLIT